MALQGAIVVLEGDDDEKFWSHPGRLDDHCQIVVAEGKLNVLGCMDILSDGKIDGVVGIVDDDYERILGMEGDRGDVVGTGVHDLECVLCQSSALDAVLVEYGNKQDIEEFLNQETERKDVRSALVERSAVFGKLRYVRERWFDEIEEWVEVPVGRFVDEDNWSVDESGIEDVVRQHAYGEEVLRRLAELEEEELWRFVHGDDILRVLRVGLRKVLGENGPMLGVGQITAVLKASLSVAELRETELGRNISSWEERNAGYRVLRL